MLPVLKQPRNRSFIHYTLHEVNCFKTCVGTLKNNLLINYLLIIYLLMSRRRKKLFRIELHAVLFSYLHACNGDNPCINLQTPHILKIISQFLYYISHISFYLISHISYPILNISHIKYLISHILYHIFSYHISHNPFYISHIIYPISFYIFCKLHTSYHIIMSYHTSHISEDK